MRFWPTIRPTLCESRGPLLASPQYGERWARHWLDVARYADGTGRAMAGWFSSAMAWRGMDTPTPGAIAIG